jgi:hypothetical protein
MYMKRRSQIANILKKSGGVFAITLKLARKNIPGSKPISAPEFKRHIWRCTAFHVFSM